MLFGDLTYNALTPLPESDAETYVDEFVYFPVEEVDAPEMLGALWSTVNVKDALKPAESYCLAFTSQPPLAPKFAVYVPSASPVNVIVFVPLPTPFPALFTTETVGVPEDDDKTIVTVLLLMYPSQVAVPDAPEPYNETEYVEELNCPILAEKLNAVPPPVVDLPPLLLYQVEYVIGIAYFGVVIAAAYAVVPLANRLDKPTAKHSANTAHNSVRKMLFLLVFTT